MLNPKEFERLVAQARIAGKRSEIVDGDGLYLDVTATGTTTWRYRYRVNSRREKITIGQYPKIGLADARAQKTILAGKATLSRSEKSILSPGQERKQAKLDERLAKQAGTISDLAVRYLASVRKRGKKAQYLDWHLNSYIVPALGTIRTPELTTEHVRRLCDKIKVTAPVSAREVLGTVKRMMRFAVGQGLIPSNPAVDLSPSEVAPKESRERSLSVDELRTFVQGCTQRFGNMSAATSAALQLLLLTLTRKGEAIKAPWSEINMDACLWEIPGERTKNGKAHVVPLSSQARAVLTSISPERTDDEPIVPHSPWLFPGAKGKPICDSTLNEALKTAKWFGLKRFTVHDLRRTASTILHEQGWNTDVIEKALNHTMRGVRGVYNRAEYLDQRREMLQAWADYLDALKTGAKVVPIGRRGKTAA